MMIIIIEVVLLLKIVTEKVNMIDEIADGVCMNVKTQKETLQKIKAFSSEFPTVFLPAHDPEAEMRLKDKIIVPCFKNVQIKKSKKPSKTAKTENRRA